MATKATKKKPTVRGLTVALRKATELTRFTKDELAIVRIHNANLEARIELAEDALAQKIKYVAAVKIARERNEFLFHNEVRKQREMTVFGRLKFLFKGYAE